MKIYWTFRNCDEHKELARKYLDRKIHRLSRRLTRFGADRCRLDLTLYYHSSGERWELRAVLALPTGRLVTVEEQHILELVIDQTIDELIAQLRRHKSRVRKEHVLRRRQHRGRELVTVLPYLERDVSQDRREEFFALLSPLMETVREHAEYELRALEEEKVIPLGELTVDDLVNEVLVLAYDRFRLRPPDSLMEAWLMELLHERLSTLAQHEPPVSMLSETEETAPQVSDADLPDPDDVNYWMTFLFEPPEQIDLEEKIPVEDVPADVNGRGPTEQQRQLRRLLSRLPKRERQALMLHETSGFEESEIATMLRVEPDEARSMIERAREKLRQNLSGLAKIGSTSETS